jgi:hypothetical protein
VLVGAAGFERPLLPKQVFYQAELRPDAMFPKACAGFRRSRQAGNFRSHGRKSSNLIEEAAYRLAD